MADLAKRFQEIMHTGGGSRFTEAAHLIQNYGISGLTGAALGYGAATMKGGLDMPVPNSTRTVPLDGALAGAGVLAILGAGHDVAPIARQVGASAFAVLLYRKGKEFTEKKGLGGPVKGALRAHGEDAWGAEDPIVALAKQL